MGLMFKGFLSVTACILLLSCGGDDLPANLGGISALGDSKLRVYVVVVDSLRDDEVGPLTPNLSALREGAVVYEGARAILPAVTLANHVSMMTGVLPNRHGMISNAYFDGSDDVGMGDPSLIEVDHLFTRFHNERPDVETAAVLSWIPIFNVFNNEGTGCEQGKQCAADFHWEPSPADPSPSDSARDIVTMEAFLGWLGETTATPQFAFVNMTDVDNSGHIDPTGAVGGLALGRQAALVQTDLQIGRLVTFLQDDPAVWASTVLFIISDHVMDWSTPDAFINLRPVLDAAGYDETMVATSDNGGHESLYVRDTGGLPLQEVVEEITTIVAGVAGVQHVVTDYTTPSRQDLGLNHPNAGELVLFSEAGFRFSDPSFDANPLPGNHGHVATQPSILMVAGGHPALAGPCTVPLASVPAALSQPVNAPGNLSIAPTVAALFGLPAPAGGYDSQALLEAFTPGCR